MSLDPAALEAALAATAAHLGVERVSGVERFPAGLSSHSYRVAAVTASGPLEWVLRIEPRFGVIPPYDIVAEARLMEAAAAAGLPVPAVVHVEEDPEVLGGRFMLMDFVAGDTYRSQDPRLGTDTEWAANLQDRFVEVLARIHAVEQDVCPIPADSRDAARAQVAVCRRRLDATAVLPHPIIADTLDFLDDTAPAGAPLVLCHGDYRLPNLKWRGGEIVAVLDWELARVGDPMADLAFTQTVGAGVCAIHGPLAEAYWQISGIAVDEARLAYYRVLELAKSVIIGLAGVHDLTSGGDDLRLLSTAGLAMSGEPVVAMLRTALESQQGAIA